MKRKRQKDHNEQEPDLKDDRNQEIIIKTSIIALLIFVFGLLSLLSLFSLSGSFGLFLDDILSLIFGWSKWLFPFLLIILSIAIYKKNKFFSKKSNYFGLSLFFIFISSLLHFFYKNDIAKIKASEGLGGGYLGFYLSLFLENSLGFWGGLVVILAILALSLILLFNVTLSHLVGSKSFLFQIFRSISNFFKINDISEEDSYSTEDENQNNYEEEIKNEKNKDDNLAEDQDVLFVKKEIGFSNNRTEDLGKKEEVLRENVNWKTKKIKIDLPLELLSNKINKATSGDIDKNILIIQRTLENFGILVEMGGVNVGPTVTQYTFKPSEGIKVSKITALNNDLSLALAAHPIRIEAPIPGKSLIGIEVPNKTKAIVGLREVLEERDFKNRQTNLMAA
ncbi:MAG: DNA translocase FtsK 4TM domain-containing protein [Patescibacteria group bacterium]|jgi:S-DNA-T family DNA segregation ATPase FtsK/SpoIIIE